MENDINASLGELRKTIESRLDSCVGRAELDEKLGKLSNDIVAKMHPEAGQRIVPATTPDAVLERAEQFKKNQPVGQKKLWTSDYGKQFGDMKTFLRSARKAYAGLSEGVNESGGYLVPTEFSSEVQRLLLDNSIIYQLARVVPMTAMKRKVPTQTAGVAAAWVEETNTKTQTKPAFGSVEQNAKVLAAIVKATDELLRDSAIDLQAFLAELISEAMSLEIERVALAGKPVASGGTDPFTGVMYASGVHSVSMSGATVSFDDFLSLVFKLNGAYSQDARIVINREGLRKIVTLKDERGNYLWQPPAGNLPATIWGVPYVISSQLPSNLGTDSDQTVALFGRFNQYLWLSPREGMEVKVSQDAYDAGDSTNAFLQDQTWLRFTQALSADVMVPAAFAKLQFK